QAFSNGFMGCKTFGYSTLVSLVSVSAEDLEELKNDLGQYLMDKYGAPTKEIATKAASEEISLMLELCKDHDKGSLLSISREWTKEGIKEKYRNLPKAESCAEQKIWTVVEEDQT
ncbi:DUF6505 family protein, partial [Alphaproteobacteria bacterium]|nr:DUF6505 family protein [Alphaproteobacteria bacterium]